MEYTQILLKPLISEKGTFLKEESNQVAFFVRRDANKVQIKKAVEDAFAVKVEAVNVVGNVVGRRPVGANQAAMAANA